MKPIHKLNNGRGATLCHTCSVIISTGLTKDLYCEKCKPKQETLEQIDQNNPITRGSTALVYKQETFEEVAEKSAIEQMEAGNSAYILGFTKGAKWQRERSYSEEEVLQILSSYADWPINDVKEWFEQFKKK
jgi:hypothetical protein